MTALSLAVAGAALGVTIALFGRSSAAAPPRYIVVQADAPREASGAGPLDMNAAGAETAALSEPPEPARTAKRENTGAHPDPAARLAESFKRQKKSVVACVNAHSVEAERTPKLAVHIALAASGAVQGARVLPAEIAGSTMGRCIERAVHAMQFPRQRSALSFEVPLTARKEE